MNKKQQEDFTVRIMKVASRWMHWTRRGSGGRLMKKLNMPITQASKELNIGLSLLKKCCRGTGYTPLALSLQTLIDNVQELWKEQGKRSEEKLKMAVEVLERERRMMEKLPDMQLEDKTKKLRQACFKANYNKRKMMAVKEGSGNTKAFCSVELLVSRGSSCSSSVSSSYSGIKNVNEEQDDD